MNQNQNRYRNRAYIFLSRTPSVIDRILAHDQDEGDSDAGTYPYGARSYQGPAEPEHGIAQTASDAIPEDAYELGHTSV